MPTAMPAKPQVKSLEVSTTRTEAGQTPSDHAVEARVQVPAGGTSEQSQALKTVKEEGKEIPRVAAAKALPRDAKKTPIPPQMPTVMPAKPQAKSSEGSATEAQAGKTPSHQAVEARVQVSAGSSSKHSQALDMVKEEEKESPREAAAKAF